MPSHDARKPRMVYLCPVDWRWIKQRPQFLAEALDRYYHLQVLYPWRNNRNDLRRKEEHGLEDLKPYFSFPEFGGRIPLLHKANEWLRKSQISGSLKRSNADILWLSHPMQRQYIPRQYRGKIVYDCMDDYAAINMSSVTKGQLIQSESILLRSADTVFASSERLYSLMLARGASKEKTSLIRNGYSPEWPAPLLSPKPKGGIFRLAYVGTLGRWLDFELLIRALDDFPWLEIHLFGPKEKGIRIPALGRLIVHGVIEHEDIPRATQDMDAFCLPFTPCEIVDSVDPVKLYEYLFLHKDVISIRYREIERYAPFVYFYEGIRAFEAQLERLRSADTPRYTIAQAQAFLKGNIWQARAETIHQIIR